MNQDTIGDRASYLDIAYVYNQITKNLNYPYEEIN